MKRTAIIVWVALAFMFLLGRPAGAQDTKLCSPVVPTDAQMMAYPYTDGKLSVEQMANLGLTPQRLRYAFEGYNFYRDAKACGGGRWVLEVIQPGEIVLVGKNGYVAYRASCGNRLVWVGKAPIIPTKVPTIVRRENPATRLWNWMFRSAWGWRPFVEIQTGDGGSVELTSGDFHVKADGNAVVVVR